MASYVLLSIIHPLVKLVTISLFSHSKMTVKTFAYRINYSQL